jgi:hypothetical protein
MPTAELPFSRFGWYVKYIHLFPFRTWLIGYAALGQFRDKLCGRLPESRQLLMLVVNTAMGALSTLVVALRLLSRFLVSKKIWVDDYFIMSAVVSERIPAPILFQTDLAPSQAVNIPSVTTGAWSKFQASSQSDP